MEERVITIETEIAKDGRIWGSTKYEENLIIESAEDQWQLEKQFAKLLFDFHFLKEGEYTIVLVPIDKKK